MMQLFILLGTLSSGVPSPGAAYLSSTHSTSFLIKEITLGHAESRPPSPLAPRLRAQRAGFRAMAILGSVVGVVTMIYAPFIELQCEDSDCASKAPRRTAAVGVTSALTQLGALIGLVKAIRTGNRLRALEKERDPPVEYPTETGDVFEI